MIRHFLLWIMGFAACWGLSRALGPAVDIVPCWMGRDTPPKDSMLAYAKLWDDLDHDAFYHAIEPRIPSRIRLADVIFVGNSRVQFGLDASQTASFFKSRQMKNYNLSFGYNQKSAWALTLLKKFRARPGWIVINADPFFQGSVSYPGDRSLERPWFNATTRSAEAQASLVQRRILEKWSFPRLRAFNAFGNNDSPVFRSVTQGSWELSAIPVYANPEKESPVYDVPAEAGDLQVDWQALGDFMGFARSRGCKVVLINIPHSRRPESSKALTRLIAQDQNVPFLDCDEAGLTTFDGQHLTKQSAQLYTSRFLTEFAKLLPPGGEGVEK